MRFESVPFGTTDSEFFQVWRQLQASSEQLASPFFSPEFAEIVARCREDLFLGILEDDGKTEGILPFHRKPGGGAVPLAGQYCDYQGVIGVPPDPDSVQEMLRAFDIACYDFNHALESQPAFSENSFWRSNSPRADLRSGYEAWKTDVSSHTKTLKSLARKQRKISREIGPLQFVEQDTNEASWRIFTDWKDQAVRRLGQPGFPGPRWATQMIASVFEAQQPSFNGCFSTLYAGDRLIAAHFGMRTARVWHWWFPSYDIELAAYSPGLLLLHNCVEAAAQAGYTELDLGRGNERYKIEFSNRNRALCEGSFERMTVLGATRSGRKAMQRLANKCLAER